MMSGEGEPVTFSGLTSLRRNYTAVVFGASGGIGEAFARLIEADGNCARLFLGSRTPLELSGLACGERLLEFAFDLQDEASLALAGERVAESGTIDLVIIATGMLHGRGIDPEKTWRSLGLDGFAQAFAINATGPALVAKHFLGRLNADSKSVFAAVSARVGSISDNRLGGWHAYRASKAALNQIIRTLSVELRVRNKLALCVGLHPGTVRTDLSAPFLGGAKRRNVFGPDESAALMLGVLDQLTPAETGRCFAWDGREVQP